MPGIINLKGHQLFDLETQLFILVITCLNSVMAKCMLFNLKPKLNNPDLNVIVGESSIGAVKVRFNS